MVVISIMMIIIVHMLQLANLLMYGSGDSCDQGPIETFTSRTHLDALFDLGLCFLHSRPTTRFITDPGRTLMMSCFITDQG